MSNSAAILTRLYNSERWMNSVVEQVRALKGEVTWRVMYSEGGDDNTRKILMDELTKGFPGNVCVIVTITPKINAQEAICRLMEQVTEDELYIFDDDNWFYPSRVRLHRDICNSPQGICAVTTVGIKNGRIWKYYPPYPTPEGMDVIIDAGAMRIKREYAQKRLVPATRKALAGGEGPGLYEDRFWAALAIKDGELCTHAYPLHFYGFRDDSQMARMGWERQERLFDWTSQKIVEALRGKLTEEETHQVLGAKLMREK
jgi:hypothetical protein